MAIPASKKIHTRNIEPQVRESKFDFAQTMKRTDNFIRKLDR